MNAAVGNKREARARDRGSKKKRRGQTTHLPPPPIDRAGSDHEHGRRDELARRPELHGIRGLDPDSTSERERERTAPRASQLLRAFHTLARNTLAERTRRRQGRRAAIASCVSNLIRASLRRRQPRRTIHQGRPRAEE
ncbi:hypothetical protein DFH09DRAFT_1321391 [Mycena vulgaris]|nr:hypothetical protein DFH09DRAFT_1321391 [Mycena vulgaris]